MKYRYYVGDATIPWWVQKLVDCGLIIEPRENAAITFFLTFKTTHNDATVHYLYDGDFLELNEDTGAVTIGYAEWDKALAEDFTRTNWQKFVSTLKKDSDAQRQKEINESSYLDNYMGKNK